MIQYSVAVTNRDAVEKLDRLNGQRVAMEGKILRRIAQGIISYTQSEKLRGQVLRRVTGNLANSLQYRMSGPHSIMVGPGMVYGAVHEFGLPERNIPKRPYLAPGIQEYFSSGRAERIAEATLQEELDRL
jgi:phage gpG-like protein